MTDSGCRSTPSSVDPVLFRRVMPTRAYNNMRYSEPIVLQESDRSYRIAVVTEDGLWVLMLGMSQVRVHEPILKWVDVHKMQRLNNNVELFVEEGVNSMSEHILVWRGVQTMECFSFEPNSKLFFHMQAAWVGALARQALGLRHPHHPSATEAPKLEALFVELEEDLKEESLDENGELRYETVRYLRLKHQHTHLSDAGPTCTRMSLSVRWSCWMSCRPRR